MQQNRDGEQKSYRLLGLFSIAIALLLPSFLWASFEDFKKQQNTSFTAYKDERDAAFNEYLKSQWQEYTSKMSDPLYEKPKPKNIASTTPKEIKSVGPLVNIKLLQIQEDTQKPIIIEIPKLQDKVKEKTTPQAGISFDFFGTYLGFDLDDNFKKAKYYPYSQKGISNFFESMASGDSQNLVEALKKTSDELELNDWGVYLLVVELSKNVYEVEDDRKLFTWFILNKLGYNVKVGLSQKHIVLMHYSEKIIYSTPNYKFGNKNFYLLSDYAKGSSKKVFTYKQDYPNADKPLDLALVKIPNFPNESREKNLLFKQFNNEYKITLNYNQNLLDFMATYPQADYETYFNAPMQNSTYEEIAKGIKEHIDGKKMSVAMNFVLNFVQSAFVYERDQQQFGREKVMFAQETLYYDKSDCEDRAILFSYLVKKLFKVGVVGVKYKDHMATALYIPMQGDSVKSGQRKFVIADPTYINANIGQSMPKYKSQIPQSFIVVKRDDI